jgi:hypothetical protein
MNQPTAAAPIAAAPSRFLRRMVLGVALLLGLAVALAPRTPTVHAQEPATPAAAPAATTKPATKSMTIKDGRGAEIKIDVSDDSRAEAAAQAAPGGSTEVTASPDGTASDLTGRREARPRKHARVTIDGLGPDRDFDSFGEFVDKEPAMAGMVVAIVAVVFLAPVLAIALVLWYRMRKARMLNETMLKLAEKGIVPSADALETLATGKPPAAAAPYYEQAKQVRRRAAWSDLRKGVLLSGLGLGLSLYSLFKYFQPNGAGLILLFVGLGFVVLWWFEERNLVPSNRAAPDMAPGPGAGAPPGNPPPA